jgi:hypothetical protein
VSVGVVAAMAGVAEATGVATWATIIEATAVEESLNYHV